MKMPLEILQTVLDFPKHSDLAISEGKKKLVDTYMYINNDLAFIKNIDSSGIFNLVIDDNLEERITFWEDVHDLKILMPKSGWYDLKSGGKIFVRKLKVKQWKKSFNFALYNLNKALTNLTEIDWSSHSKFAINKNSLYYYDLKIGFVLEDKIYVTNPLFYQEVLDTWGNQYEIKIAE